ncbi:hypothetical protein Dimus_028361 [Dionaea muscipula]
MQKSKIMPIEVENESCVVLLGSGILPSEEESHIVSSDCETNIPSQDVMDRRCSDQEMVKANKGDLSDKVINESELTIRREEIRAVAVNKTTPVRKTRKSRTGVDSGLPMTQENQVTHAGPDVSVVGKSGGVGGTRKGSHRCVRGGIETVYLDGGDSLACSWCNHMNVVVFATCCGFAALAAFEGLFRVWVLGMGDWVSVRVLFDGGQYLSGCVYDRFYCLEALRR